MKKPELKISILSDYICPFCFIGDLRLDVLREAYDLKVNWCFIEIHPETPAAGHSIKRLNYSDETWGSMMKNLLELAEEENIKLCEQTRITNSRKALLLSEACKTLGADVFYPLHQHIFNSCFIEGRNIGEEAVLRDIARQHDIPESTINQAWNEEYANGPADSVPASLLSYLQYAGALQVKSVPCFIIGKQILSGVITRKELLTAAKKTQEPKNFG
ncbi:hypothetical protein MNBD_GAMMA09-362 [hydrothermal vent metagenome]|uniref:DSBA-like thioredoxin domain-containing protein n=1 Tax=hydrothermal vent metagenome TaxID=652676 RepID=A0A3B0XYB8_9ZZZZ